MKTMTEKQKNLLLRIIAAAILMAALLILPLQKFLPAQAVQLVRFLLFLIPYFTVGHDILRKAVKGIRNRQVFDENFLMAAATVGAMALGEYTEAVAVMLFYQIGELFQSYAVGKSRRNISELMDIRPDYANLETEEGIVQADPDDVEPGSIIVIQPGERVPIDGIILEGVSSLDTAALTGESLPRDVRAGQEILSGSINLTGVLRVKTTKEFEESTASRILDLVENAGTRKAKSEQFITKFARWYTPAVCYGALALAILGPVFSMLIFHAAGGWALWSDWIYRALTFLVISCPCAIVVSIPLTFFGGIGGAGSRGILIKGSNFMETLAEVRTVVFDKTGTLTKGNFVVTKICPAQDLDAAIAGFSLGMKSDGRISGISSETGFAAAPGQPVSEIGSAAAPGQPVSETGSVAAPGQPVSAAGSATAYTEEEEHLLKFAALAEMYSRHPISQSLKAAYRKPLVSVRIGKSKEISGRGVVTVLDGHPVAVGNLQLMQDQGVTIREEDDHSAAETGTVVHVSLDKKYLGHIVISDEIKPQSAEAIRALKKEGVAHTIMLTGDSEGIAAHVAGELKIDEYHAGLLPEDKVRCVEMLLDSREKEPGTLAFVGDGINDAPVLARADLGIAMGALGSDAAIEAADVVLMDDDPMKIAQAVRLARKCIRIVRENIWFAIGVKAICLVLGAAGIANMWLAIFADVGVMVLCVLNAIRALV